ncbi:hypothetical protein [Rhodococcus sp. NPDC127528]|uniref:hypothetical protein n=1 Tax=unclassified Rhodococcus (in: high G+C Gram-positive bacteria) TaxID=192944 RepID=UPI003633467C
MNTNVAQLLAMLAVGIGGTAAVQAARRQSPGQRGQHRRAFHLGSRIMRPHG